MRNIHVAESILRLATSPDRAASTVGDLLEQTPARGHFWFWSCILRTLTSLVWREMVDSPARVTGVAFLSLALDLAVVGFVAALTGIVFFYAALRTGHTPHVSSFALGIWVNAPTLVVSFVIGRMLTRWAPRRELAVCLAYLLLVPVCNLAASIVEPGPTGFYGLTWEFLCTLALRTPALAGVIRSSRRRMVSAG